MKTESIRRSGPSILALSALLRGTISGSCLPGTIRRGLGYWAIVFLCVASALAQEDGKEARTPLGVYAHVSIETAIQRYPGSPNPTQMELHAYLQGLYTKLLSNSAVAGIAVGVRWDRVQVADPICSLQHSCPPFSIGGYNWSFLDDIFTVIKHNPGKTVELNVTPGVDTPGWVLDKIPSCDSLFTGDKKAPHDCGKVTFEHFPEQQRADGRVMPLPWNPTYVGHWYDFLEALNERYGSNRALVAIAVAGPNCASPEMIVPTSLYGSYQLSGTAADEAWNTLFEHSFPNRSEYHDSDLAFIEAWEQTVNEYERIFSNITLVISPDIGDSLPEYAGPITEHGDKDLYKVDCSTTSTPMSCEAKTAAIAYFIAAKGHNEKASQVGGLTARSSMATGDIGLPGVKLLSSLAPAPVPAILGGAEFDFSATTPNTMIQQGCLENPKSPKCDSLNAEEAVYNTLVDFFHGTAGAVDFGGDENSGDAPIQSLVIDYDDMEYAMEKKHRCSETPTTVPDELSVEDLLNLANYDLIHKIAGKPATLPPRTCPID